MPRTFEMFDLIQVSNNTTPCPAFLPAEKNPPPLLVHAVRAYAQQSRLPASSFSSHPWPVSGSHPPPSTLHCRVAKNHSCHVCVPSCHIRVTAVVIHKGCRLSLADTSAKWLNTTSTAWISFGKQGNISCNATQGASDVLSIDKVDFLKLQNGSDIRGVAIAGVEGA
uniref:Uncharacterized protein n=1 Tax=Aegilops tauschii TaxID=37682 RepID=R7W134_AEGTA